MNIQSILRRSPYKRLTDHDVSHLKGFRILITGGTGKIGLKIEEVLKSNDITYLNTDINTMDVTNKDQVNDVCEKFNPDFIIHLAGAKHAPVGEIETEMTFNINTMGTLNILKTGKKVIFTSTCKACNPETVYGASKLIAERLVLNAGGTVVRFYNVVETDGNVFDIWRSQQDIDVAAVCNRFFISLDESVGLILESIKLNSGRYAVKNPIMVDMYTVAKSLYPDKKINLIQPRKGDRLTEKLISTSERLSDVNEAISKITSYHD